ncbi:MAG: stage II sporulation protein R [Clostridiales bacterium]|nr:stage II sporulation protein R [Clostridiales bacterium]
MFFKRIISYILIIIISLILTASASSYPGPKQQLIRFHVIANSDSKEDQAVKLKVRDRLLEEFGQELGRSHSLEESRKLILEKMDEIERTAQQEVDKYLAGYKVQAVLGHFDFPTKAYGNMILPAGNYEALRIVIGKGQGANWWCVMFPPLCFVDITHGVASENINLAEDMEEETKIVYKFKIVEWWDKLISLFS